MGDAMGQTTVVVVDTTELKGAEKLDRAGWPQLLAWVRAWVVDGAVSEVVVLEASRHFARQRQDDLQKFRQAVKRLDSTAAVRELDLDSIAEELRAEIAKYSEWLRLKLTDNGSRCGRCRQCHTAMSSREIWRNVNRSTSPARDTGMPSCGNPFWSTCRWSHGTTLFCSYPETLKDFASRDGALNEGLASEATEKGGQVVLINSLKAAVDYLRDDAEEALAALFADSDIELARRSGPNRHCHGRHRCRGGAVGGRGHRRQPVRNGDARP